MSVQPRAVPTRYYFRRFIYFTVPTLVPVLILGVYAIIATTRSLTEQIGQAHASGLGQIADLLGFVDEEMDSLYLSFGLTPEVMTRLQGAFRVPYGQLDLDSIKTVRMAGSFLDVAVNSKNYLHSIYVYYRNDFGQFLCSGLGIAFLDAYPDGSWYHTFASAALPFGTRVEARSLVSFAGERPTEVLTFYRNLFPASSAPLGVVVLNVKTDHLTHLIERAFPSRQTAVFIVDRDGGPIMADNPLGLTRFDLARLVRTGKRLTEVDTSKGVLFASSLPVAKYDCTIVAASPVSLIRKVVGRISATLYALLAASLLLGVVAAYALHRRDFRRLASMVQIMEAARRNAPLPTIEAPSDDEFGYVVQGLLTNFIEQSYLRLHVSEQNYRLKYSELLALQAQINPHFLFNTLESINWAVMRLSGRSTRVNRLISHLASLLKYSLSSPDQLAPLPEEIASARSYLEIQKHRYPRKFSVVWELNERETSRVQVPRLILQPLLENAVYHGIKEKEGRGRLRVAVHVSGGSVEITVADDGVGMPADRLDEVRALLDQESPSQERHGLHNTWRRLRLLFGDSATIRIASRMGQGTSVTLRLPAGHRTRTAR